MTQRFAVILRQLNPWTVLDPVVSVPCVRTDTQFKYRYMLGRLLSGILEY